MAIYGYIENKTQDRLIITSLAISLPAGWVEEFDESDVRPVDSYRVWERAIPELESLVAAGTIEIREPDNTTVVPAEGVQAWVDREVVTLSSLPPIGRDKLETSDPDNAVITRLIASTGINIQSSGPQDGTGDVTIEATSAGLPSFLIQRSTGAIIVSRDGGFVLVRD